MTRFGAGLASRLAAGCLFGGILALALPGGTAEAAGCQLQSAGNKIQHVVYLQFDNVHLRRDNPNVPSDLEQMPNLLNFLTNNGSVLTRHHTPLISHTSVDILTSLTGVYGDTMGISVGNTLRYYNPDGTTQGAVSFAYWTDPLASFSPATDTTPQMDDPAGKTHPAPWVPFTRAGCDVGAFSIANMELENTTSDIVTVFGSPSSELTEAMTNPTMAAADFEGIAIHCAQGSLICAGGQDDNLPQEPGAPYTGAAGFKALFGNKFVAPAITHPSAGVVNDLDGNPITNGEEAPLKFNGFPCGFNPSATQTLGYLATMLEAHVPVVYGYIEDAHDRHTSCDSADAHAFGPGEAEYVAQLAAFDKAFGQFFTRLHADGITKDNTLFIFTADENDHFAGGSASPGGCDGVTTPCTYTKVGEVQADLRQVIFTETSSPGPGDSTPFTVHSDDAPAVYVTGTPADPIPGQTEPAVRQLEREAGALIGVDPITGTTNMLTQALADHAEMDLLHMIMPDSRRNPTFILFANPDYFLFASSATACSPLAACFVEAPGFAWNHGDFQEEITNTWLGMAGPGVLNLGQTGVIFSDHTDIRPTLLNLVGLKDDYSHDGRTLLEVLDPKALPASLSKHGETLHDLGVAFKAINAPRGTLGAVTLTGISTAALKGNDATYTQLEADINALTAQRNTIVGQILPMLENAEFNNTPIDNDQARHLIKQADDLVKSVSEE